MICGHRHEQKFRYPYPRDSKKIQIPYPRAKVIDQNPALCPASRPPPPQLDIDRCINTSFYIELGVHVNEVDQSYLKFFHRSIITSILAITAYSISNILA